MSQMLLWILALLAAFDILDRSEVSGQDLRAVLVLRRQLMLDPEKARLKFCQESPSEGLQLLWREAGRWSTACSKPRQSKGPPRYWRLEVRLKYGMLFLLELPITVSIVILA